MVQNVFDILEVPKSSRERQYERKREENKKIKLDV